MKPTPTVKKIETLAKQVQLFSQYRDQYRALQQLPARYLNIHCRSLVPGNHVSTIVNLQLPGMQQAANVFFLQLEKQYCLMADNKLKELTDLVRVHFPEKTAQDKILLRFLPGKTEKGTAAPNHTNQP